jgi:tetratricopeptide (TPR) repeat protein
MANGPPLEGRLAVTLNQALALHQAGQHARAEELYNNVLANHPEQFEALHFLGLLHAERGQLNEADRLIARSLKVNQQRPEAFANHARVLNGLKRAQDALACCDTALAMNPRMVEALVSRGNALQELGRIDEAVASYDRALVIEPSYLAALLNRGASLGALGRHAEAVASYERAVSLAGRSALVPLAMGTAPGAAGAPALNPGLAAMHRNLGLALHVMERHAEALAHLETAQALNPGDAETRANLSLVYLGLGRFAEGWSLHDSRFAADKTAQRRDERAPRWNGEPINGTLLVWGEQGLGDQILYANTIPDLLQRTGPVVVQVEPRLVDLFRRSFPAATVEPLGAQPSVGPIQAQVAIGSLPHVLRRSWDDFLRARRAYLEADTVRTEALRQRLAVGGRRVIGLSWKSANPQHEKAKSAQLRDFETVLRLPNCRFVDLQYGDTAPDRADVERAIGVRVEHLDDIDNTRDIDGLAALIAACDVVVTVSNTTAHLAGALGRPTLVLVPLGRARHWYWFNDREDSPWYPHVHIRRQRSDQSWAQLVASHVGKVEALAIRP